MRSVASYVSLFVLTLALIPTVACVADADANSDEAGEDGAGATADELRSTAIGPESNGKTVEVEVGRPFTVALPEGGSNGYIWRVTDVDAVLGNAKVRGDGPSRKFTWKTDFSRVGKHTIAFALQSRTGSPSASPLEQFTVTVDVVGPVLIDESFNGKTVKLALGKSFAIVLPEEAAKGYAWFRTADEGLGDPVMKFEGGDTPPPVIPGTREYTWTPSVPSMVGLHTISLNFKQVLALHDPPLKTFTVTVDIAAP